MSLIFKDWMYKRYCLNGLQKLISQFIQPHVFPNLELTSVEHKRRYIQERWYTLLYIYFFIFLWTITLRGHWLVKPSFCPNGCQNEDHILPSPVCPVLVLFCSMDCLICCSYLNMNICVYSPPMAHLQLYGKGLCHHLKSSIDKILSKQDNILLIKLHRTNVVL